jgi:predicted ATPase
MAGRESELKSLKDILQSCQKEGKIAVSITGIGGIGYVI